MRLSKSAMAISAALALAPAVTRLFAADLAAEGKRWWSYVEVLASDAMEGRATGSTGHLRAAEYVAREFSKAGLKPAGTRAYLQNIRFNVVGIDESKSSLALVRDGVVTPLVLGDDATLGRRAGLAPKIEADAVFCGYGLTIPEANFDDFADVDVRGKIVVYLAGGPAGVSSALRAHYSSAGERWKAASQKGAVGLVSIANPKNVDIPWERSRLARLTPTMSLADDTSDKSPPMRVSAAMNPARADKLLGPPGHSLAELLPLADQGKPLPHFDLGLKLRATETLVLSQVESPNVVGFLQGSDPKLGLEYVVFSAHLDHLGVGEPINGDKIYNGAMDDASGVASLLEIANQFKEHKTKLKRSVLFVAVTGEEKGDLGSDYFAKHPTVPGKNIVADINMDMYLPLFPMKYLEVQGLPESTLGDTVRDAAAKFGVEVQPDKEPGRNLIIRSDQYSFVKQGVPALAFKFGYTPGSMEEKASKDWLRDRYHAPSDDLNQPVDKSGAALFNRIMAALGESVANASTPPQWKSDSFFRRFAK